MEIVRIFVGSRMDFDFNDNCRDISISREMSSKSMDSGKIHTIEFGKSICYRRHFCIMDYQFFSSVKVRNVIK